MHHMRDHNLVDGGPPSALPAFDSLPLTKDSGILAIAQKMRQPDSGLEVKDRTWLKLKISNAFLGSDMVEWLHTKVEGFQVRCSYLFKIHLFIMDVAGSTRGQKVRCVHAQAGLNQRYG